MYGHRWKDRQHAFWMMRLISHKRAETNSKTTSVRLENLFDINFFGGFSGNHVKQKRTPIASTKVKPESFDDAFVTADRHGL